MEQDIKGSGSGSDSDLSDGWTLLNCSPEHDVIPNENEHAEASDEDSIESFGAEKLEMPKRDEESDGISIISESDVCDHLETIPAHSQVMGDEVIKEYDKESLTDSEIPPVQHPTWRRKHLDSLSESDSCELADSPENLPLCPRKVRRQKLNRPLPSTELDSCDYIEDLPVLAGNNRMQSGDEARFRIYVHRPNNHINYLLTVLVALVMAAVAGLGTGHFLGTKEMLMSPEEIVYRLKLENQILHTQVQELLKERDLWRRISATFCSTMSENNGKFMDLCLGSSKYSNSTYYFPVVPSVLNHSLNDNEILTQGNSYGEKRSPSKWRIGFHNISSIPDKLLLQNQLVGSSLEVNFKDNKHTMNDVNENMILKNIVNYASDMEVPHSSYEFKFSHEKTDAKLADDVKSALFHGLELSDKLKETLSFIDTAFVDWKSLKAKGTGRNHVGTSFGKKALKELKHVLYDGTKAKMLISKTVDKLNSMKKKLFKKYDKFNLWEKNEYFTPNVELSPNILSVSSSKELHEPFSNHYSNSGNNYFKLKSNFQLPSDLVYGPKLFTLDPKLFIEYPSEHSSSIHDMARDEYAIENRGSKSQSVSNDGVKLVRLKQARNDEIDPKASKIPLEKLDGKPNSEKPNRNYMNKPKNKEQPTKNSSKQNKEKYNPNEQHTMKFKEGDRSDNDHKYSHEKHKKQKRSNAEEYSVKYHEHDYKYSHEKHKKQKRSNAEDYSVKGLKGEKIDKSYINGHKYEKESKYKSKPKEYEYKKDNKIRQKSNEDLGTNFDGKVDQNSYKNMKSQKKNNKDSYGKLYDNSYKQMKNLNYKDYKKAYKIDGFRHNKAAWSMDENYRLNISGDWFIKLNEARSKQRENDQKSDWIFERAIARKLKREEDRERARWYFLRAEGRQNYRGEQIPDWNKNQKKKNFYKFDKGDFFKKSPQFNENNFDDYSQHYQKEWKPKHTSKHWKGFKFISQAFKTAMNLMKA